MNQTQRNYAINRLEEIAKSSIDKMVRERLANRDQLRSSIEIDDIDLIREKILDEILGPRHGHYCGLYLSSICNINEISKSRTEEADIIRKEIKEEVDSKLQLAKDGIMLGNAEEVKKAIAKFEQEL